jgi:hypothetical protein
MASRAKASQPVWSSSYSQRWTMNLAAKTATQVRVAML